MGRGLAWRMERVALWSSVVVGLCGAYAPPLRYFASCARGLESVLASELSSEVIGASRVTVGSAGCEFDGDVGVLYRAGLEARTATKVSELLACECGVGTAEEHQGHGYASRMSAPLPKPPRPQTTSLG